MRFILKLVAAPFALSFTVAAVLLAFTLAASEIFFRIASILVFIGALILFISGEPVGGGAFLVVAFLVSPYGIHAVAGRLAGLFGSAGGALKTFILS